MNSEVALLLSTSLNFHWNWKDNRTKLSFVISICLLCVSSMKISQLPEIQDWCWLSEEFLSESFSCVSVKWMCFLAVVFSHLIGLEIVFTILQISVPGPHWVHVSHKKVLVLVLKLSSWYRSWSWKVLLTSLQYGTIVSVRLSFVKYESLNCWWPSLPGRWIACGWNARPQHVTSAVYFVFVAIVWTFISTREMLHSVLHTLERSTSM